MEQQEGHSMDVNAKQTYTSDQLLKKFGSQFELVNYAIRLAENLIKTGRATENPALQVISEISCNEDHFEEIPETIIEVQTLQVSQEALKAPARESTIFADAKTKKKIKVPL